MYRPDLKTDTSNKPPGKNNRPLSAAAASGIDFFTAALWLLLLLNGICAIAFTISSTPDGSAEIAGIAGIALLVSTLCLLAAVASLRAKSSQQSEELEAHAMAIEQLFDAIQTPSSLNLKNQRQLSAEGLADSPPPIADD